MGPHDLALRAHEGGGSASRQGLGMLDELVVLAVGPAEVGFGVDQALLRGLKRPLRLLDSLLSLADRRPGAVQLRADWHGLPLLALEHCHVLAHQAEGAPGEASRLDCRNLVAGLAKLRCG